MFWQKNTVSQAVLAEKRISQSPGSEPVSPTTAKVTTTIVLGKKKNPFFYLIQLSPTRLWVYLGFPTLLGFVWAHLELRSRNQRNLAVVTVTVSVEIPITYGRRELLIFLQSLTLATTVLCINSSSFFCSR